MIINSLFVSKSIKETMNFLKNAPDNTSEYDLYNDIYQHYMKKQKIISITVSHDCLREIENNFCEILGSIEANDEESLIIAKSRLIGALEHLQRLSGINADSIF